MHPIAQRLHPQRLRRTVGAASCVRERGRFVVSELRNVPSLGRYRLRGSGLTTHIRHPLLDMWGLEELFRFRVYDPPDEVVRALAAVERPLRILDLGGNVGFFGLFVREQFADARLVSFEPDPGNASVLRDSIRANGLEESWQLIEACAAPADGSVSFESSFHLSRAGGDADAALARKQSQIAAFLPFLAGTPLVRSQTLQVAARDVFPYLRNADLVKIDIEGGEWPILADPRFAQLDAAALVMEYHPSYRSEGDAAEAVRRALEAAGYTVGRHVPGDDAAVLWAWKSRPRTS